LERGGRGEESDVRENEIDGTVAKGREGGRGRGREGGREGGGLLGLGGPLHGPLSIGIQAVGKEGVREGGLERSCFLATILENAKTNKCTQALPPLPPSLLPFPLLSIPPSVPPSLPAIGQEIQNRGRVMLFDRRLIIGPRSLLLIRVGA